MKTLINLFILTLIVLIIFVLKLILQKRERFSPELFFIHIPKNAGTSIEDFAKKNNIDWGRYFKFNMSESEKKCNKWHVPPKYFTSDCYKNKKLFCVVRNPYSRIVSEYNYRKKEYNITANLNKWVKDLPDKFKNNKFSYDCHLLPQIEYLKNKDETIDKNIEVLKFENLNNDFLNFLKKNNYNFKENTLPKNNTSSKQITIDDLDEESKNIVFNLYKIDFEYFNYQK